MKWITLSETKRQLGLSLLDKDVLRGLYPTLGPEWYEGCEARSVKMHAFQLQQDPVTNGEFCAFLNVAGNQLDGGSQWYWDKSPYSLITIKDGRYIPKDGMDHYPVTGVSLSGARAFAKSHNARLPTENEWEYAARADTTTLWPSGNNGPGESCNHWELDQPDCLEAMAVLNDGRGPTPVTLFPPNAWGLRDMLGNVWEWCEPSEREDPSFGVLRGGSWNDILPIVFLPAFRHRCPMNYPIIYTFGLRLARDK